MATSSQGVSPPQITSTTCDESVVLQPCLALVPVPNLSCSHTASSTLAKDAVGQFLIQGCQVAPAWLTATHSVTHRVPDLLPATATNVHLAHKAFAHQPFLKLALMLSPLGLTSSAISLFLPILTGS